MTSMPYAIFIDIDDTLMAKNEIAKENITTIERVRGLGHKVFLNTGRSYASIPNFVLSATEYDGVVAGLGAYVRVGEDQLKFESIPNDLMVKLIDFLFETGKTTVIGGEKDLFYINDNGARLFSFGDDKVKGPRPIESSNAFRTKYKDIGILKGTVYEPLNEKEIDYLSRYFTVYQHKHYAEFGMKGCSKTKGMQLVLDHLQIPKARSIAIGDSVNDLDMLKNAGISVAMGNADDSIKAACDIVTERAEEAGVAKALIKILPLSLA